MRLFLPDSHHEIKFLARVTKSQAAVLSQCLNSSEKADYTDLAKKLKIGPDSAANLIGFLGFLGDYYSDEKITLGEIRESLDAACKEYAVSPTNLPTAVALINTVIQRESKTITSRKKTAVVRGLNSRLTGVKSLVELRPVFNQERDTIDTWVTSSVIRIGYETPSNESNYIVLDLGKDGVEKLSEAINILKKKMEIVDKKCKEAKLQ